MKNENFTIGNFCSAPHEAHDGYNFLIKNEICYRIPKSIDGFALDILELEKYKYGNADPNIDMS